MSDYEGLDARGGAVFVGVDEHVTATASVEGVHCAGRVAMETTFGSIGGSVGQSRSAPSNSQYDPVEVSTLQVSEEDTHSR